MKKLHKFTSLSVVLGCAALVLFGTAAEHPPRTIPLNGTFGTSFKLIPTDTEGFFNNPIEGVGNVSELGPCTLVVQQTADFRNTPPTLNSQWVLTFANGDELYVISQGTGTPLETNPSFFNLAGEATITGGTGRFANATGVLRFPGVAHVDTAPGLFPAEGHGSGALEGLVRLGRH
jgi:hypothetical protein